MYVINTRINNVTVTFKFRILKHAIARAQEIALSQGKAGVKVITRDKMVRAIDGQLYWWMGAPKTYLIGAGAAQR